MKVTMRSDDAPDVVVEANEAVGLVRLDQHIRTLQTARRWLRRELVLKRQRQEAAAKAAKSAAKA